MAQMRYIEAVAPAEIERTRWGTTPRVQCGEASPWRRAALDYEPGLAEVARKPNESL